MFFFIVFHEKPSLLYSSAAGRRGKYTLAVSSGLLSR